MLAHLLDDMSTNILSEPRHPVETMYVLTYNIVLLSVEKAASRTKPNT